MNAYNVELIPNVLKPSRPTQFDGESFTVLEYVSKMTSKMNECINLFNTFTDDVKSYCKEFTANTDKDCDLFQRTIEQKFQDFIGVIELKYQHQDMVVNSAVAYMKDNLSKYVEEVVDVMVSSGEMNETILNAVGNLQKDFNSTIEVVNSFINSQTAAFNKFVSEQTTAYEEFTTNHSETIENLITQVDASVETLKNEAETVMGDASTAANRLNDVINALNLQIFELDGMHPNTNTTATDYDGGRP